MRKTSSANTGCIGLNPCWKYLVICVQPLLWSSCGAICTWLQKCGLGRRKTGNWGLIKPVLKPGEQQCSNSRTIGRFLYSACGTQAKMLSYTSAMQSKAI